jgi:hypothetical protein
VSIVKLISSFVIVYGLLVWAIIHFFCRYMMNKNRSPSAKVWPWWAGWQIRYFDPQDFTETGKDWMVFSLRVDLVMAIVQAFAGIGRHF